MADDFDSLVDDILSDLGDEDSDAGDSPDDSAVDATDGAGSGVDDDAFDLVEDSLLAPDPKQVPDDDEEEASGDSYVLASGDEASDEEPEPPPKPKVEPKKKSAPAKSERGAAKKPKPKEQEAAKSPSLPLSTGSRFDHPNYVVAQTLSMISARRVIGTEGVEAGPGRSKAGEELLAGIENDLKIELRKQAGERGAHAVLGVRTTLVATGGMLYAHAEGTPIRLKKRDA